MNPLRILKIVNLIIASDQEAEQLRTDFQISSRQLGRDIFYARRMGADIVTRQEGHTYYYTCRNRDYLKEEGRFERYLQMETEIWEAKQ